MSTLNSRRRVAAGRASRRPIDPAADWAKWRPATGHRSGWRVIRYLHGPITAQQEYETSLGNRRIYKSFAAAKRVADKLNGGPA